MNLNDFGEAFTRAYETGLAVDALRERPYFTFLWATAAAVATIGLHAVMWVAS